MSSYKKLSREEKIASCRKWKVKLAQLGLTLKDFVSLTNDSVRYRTMSDWINGHMIASEESYLLVNSWFKKITESNH